MAIWRRLGAVLAVLALVLAASVAHAQSLPGLPGLAPEPEAPPESSAPTAAPEPSSPSRLAADLERATETVDGIEQGTSVPASVTKLQEDIEEREATLEQRESATRRLLEGAAGPQYLRDQLPEWRRTLEGLKVDTATVLAWVQHLDTQLETLDSVAQTWTRHRDGPELPPALGGRVEDLLARVTALEASLTEARATALALALRLGDLQESAERLEDAIGKGIRRRLLTRDSPPLWRTALRSQSTAAIADRLATASRDRRQALFGYVDAAPRRIGVHLALTLILLLAAFRIRRLSEAEHPPKPSFAGRALLDYPYSAALQVSLTLGFFLYADAPSSLVALLVILVAAPLVRLLRLLASSGIANAATALLLMYVVFRTLSALAGGEALFRFILAGIGVVGVVVGLWARRLIAPDQRPLGEGGSGPLRIVVRGAIALLAISVLANVLGMVALTIFLVDATLEAVLLAVLLWLTQTVLEGALEIGLHSPAARHLTLVRRHDEVIARRGRRWIRLGAAAAWILGTLDLFSLLDPTVETTTAILRASATIGNLEFSLGSLLAFVLGLMLAVWASRTLQAVLEEDVLPRMELPAGVPGAISKTAQYVVLTLGFLFALSAAGVQLSSFAFLAGALGVGIGFGLQTIVNNFVSGLILLFERPIKEGDIIEVGTLLGTVEHIGIRACRVRTLQGAEVIVPNGNLVSNDVVNWTLTDRLRRVELPVGVVYGTDPSRVLALLVACCKEHPDVRPHPAPDALFQGFGDSSLDFVVRGWVPFEDFFRVRSDLAVAVNNALKAAHIEIPFPQRDLHLRSVSEGILPKVGGVPPDDGGG